MYPEFREYERTVITLLNAYLVPVMSRYLEAAEDALRSNGVDAPLLIMQSNGGMASAEQVAEAPVYSVLSGPAAGVVASAYTAQQSEQPNLITLDVGGTSTDIGVVTDGRARMTTTATVGERPVNVPMVDVNAIGAGGGSIAWIGPGPSLKVGPHSAGADPGPACYDHGGTDATVTDANLVLGRIPDTLIGGGMALDRARAESAIAEIGRRIGLDPLATAWGIAEIAAENMCHGIREMTVRRGHDPRDFALFAYGGAGPMYATRIAQLLEISTVIVPRFPGVHAALGLLVSDLRQDRVVSCHQDTGALNLDQVREAYRDLEQDIHASFERHGLLDGGVSLNRAADFRTPARATRSRSSCRRAISAETSCKRPWPGSTPPTAFSSAITTTTRRWSWSMSEPAGSRYCRLCTCHRSRRATEASRTRALERAACVRCHGYLQRDTNFRALAAIRRR